MADFFKKNIVAKGKQELTIANFA